MGKFTGRFGRRAKTTEKIIAEFQNEWDAEEYQEEPYGDLAEEYSDDSCDGGQTEDYGEFDLDGGFGADDEEEDTAHEELGEYGPEFMEREQEEDSDLTENDLEEESGLVWSDEDPEEEGELKWPDGDLDEENGSEWPDEDLEEENGLEWSDEHLEEENESEWPDGDLDEENGSEWLGEDLEEENGLEWSGEDLEEENGSEWSGEDLEEESEFEWPDEDLEEENGSKWPGEDLEEENELEWSDEDLEEENESEWPDEDLEEENGLEWSDEDLEEESEFEWPDEDLEEENESERSDEDLEKEYESLEEENESEWSRRDLKEVNESEWSDENFEEEYESLEGEDGSEWPGEGLEEEDESEWPGEDLEEEYQAELPDEDFEEEYVPEYREVYLSEYREEDAGAEEYEPEFAGEEADLEYYGEERSYLPEEMVRSSRSRSNDNEEEEGDRILDKFIIIAGVAVLLMALVTGCAFIALRMRGSRTEAVREVGAQLAGVELIGGQGLDAVSNAQQVYAAALLAMATPEPVATPQPQDYEEQEYKPSVNVQMHFSSIEKDLKIKFINKETGKLISNVPFSVNIIEPGGTAIMWSDDDMDGIIYKKNLTPGQYSLVMNALTDEKYKSYGLVTAEQKAEVKKEIEYKKVDVSDEVKTEAQVNVAKEDTKINETVVESYLQDTVAWVESTSTTITYAEVAKSNIPDPMTLAVSDSLVRLSRQAALLAEAQTKELKTQPMDSSAAKTLVPYVGTLTAESAVRPMETLAAEHGAKSAETSVTLHMARGAEAPVSAFSAPLAGALSLSTEPPAAEPTAQPAEPPAAEPTAQPTEPPAAEPTAQPTEPPAAEPTEIPSMPSPVPAALPPTPPPVIPVPTPTSAPAAYTAKVVPESMTLAVGEQFAAGVSCAGVTIQNISWNSSDPAAVTVDQSGNVTAVAATQQPVLISYIADGVDSMGNAVSGITASCAVTVSAANRNLKLDKAAESVYAGASINLTAILENGFDTDVLTVESSDINVARAEISGRTITVTGLGAGVADITVKYGENNNTISATCAVTVKPTPRENRTSPLKDKDGNELYVQENNNYRQAFYADYYVFDKFFKKGETKYTGWQTIGGAVKYFDLNGNAVTGEQIIQGVKYNFASDGTLTVGAGTMGIDVSRWNGTIDWSAVKNSGVSYVIIRCGYRGSSQGTLIVDPMFQNNIKGATDAGLKVGVYFFTQAIDKVEAVEEASMVLELIRNYRISYPVFLDVEPSGGRADAISVETRTEVCRTFCQTIQNEGYTAGIYANKTWLTEKINTSQLGAYKIWLAQYISAPTYTGRYDMWQYKSTGKVSGITGDVDLNLSYLGY